MDGVSHPVPLCPSLGGHALIFLREAFLPHAWPTGVSGRVGTWHNSVYCTSLTTGTGSALGTRHRWSHQCATNLRLLLFRERPPSSCSLDLNPGGCRPDTTGSPLGTLKWSQMEESRAKRYKSPISGNIIQTPAIFIWFCEPTISSVCLCLLESGFLSHAFCLNWYSKSSLSFYRCGIWGPTGRRERSKVTPEECAPDHLQYAVSLPPSAHRQWVWSEAINLLRVETGDALRPSCVATTAPAVLGRASLENMDFPGQPKGLGDPVSARVEWRFCYPNLSTAGCVLWTSATGKTVSYYGSKTQGCGAGRYRFRSWLFHSLVQYKWTVTIMPQVENCCLQKVSVS